MGEELPAWIERALGKDLATLAAHDSQILLSGSPIEMADELQRRRDAYGLSRLSVLGPFMQPFAPVLERLTGR